MGECRRSMWRTGRGTRSTATTPRLASRSSGSGLLSRQWTARHGRDCSSLSAALAGSLSEDLGNSWGAMALNGSALKRGVKTAGCLGLTPASTGSTYHRTRVTSKLVEKLTFAIEETEGFGQ